jgi:cell division protein ZapA (FtsZ GTPase activity inhibitor)
VAEAAGGGSRLNRVRVTIAGNEYHLRTDEPVKQVEKLAARVDRELRELAGRFPGVTLERLAVLLALRLAGQLERAREQARAARKAPPAGAAAASSPRTAASSSPAEAEAATTTSTSLFDPPQGDPTL